VEECRDFGGDHAYYVALEGAEVGGFGSVPDGSVPSEQMPSGRMVDVRMGYWRD